MNPRAILEFAQKLVEEAGGRVISHSRNKHLKLECEFSGLRRIVVMSMTASDHRTKLNERTTVRRVAEACRAEARQSQPMEKKNEYQKH